MQQQKEKYVEYVLQMYFINSSARMKTVLRKMNYIGSATTQRRRLTMHLTNGAIRMWHMPHGIHSHL